MKKYVLVSALILLIAISFILYIFRAQDLGDVIKIDQVDRIFLTTVDREKENEGISIEIPKINQEQKIKLSDFLNQYQVRLTMKEGWSSEDPSEQFTMRIVYKNGEFEIFIFDHDVVASTQIYEVVNAPLDYKWIQDFERELHSNE